MSASVHSLAPTSTRTEPNTGPISEPIAARVRRLQAEAKAMAGEHIAELEHALDAVERLAEEIAEGGDAYPVGVREVARQLHDDCEARGQTIEAILHRAKS